MNLLLIILFSMQTIAIIKPDGDFSCKITGVTKEEKIALTCSDGTRLLVPRSEWRYAWGQLPASWGELELVGRIYYAQRKDGHLTAVAEAPKDFSYEGRIKDIRARFGYDENDRAWAASTCVKAYDIIMPDGRFVVGPCLPKEWFVTRDER
jgi:hypothetical protein